MFKVSLLAAYPLLAAALATQPAWGHPLGNLSELRRACDAGDIKACLLGGSVAMPPNTNSLPSPLRGAEIERVLQSFHMLNAACRLRPASSVFCRRVGLVETPFWRELLLLAGEKHQLGQLDGLRCNQGVYGACVGYAVYLMTTAPQTPERSVQLLDRACRKGALGGCLVLSRWYWSGTHMSKDPAVAIRYRGMANRILVSSRIGTGESF